MPMEFANVNVPIVSNRMGEVTQIFDTNGTREIWPCVPKYQYTVSFSGNSITSHKCTWTNVYFVFYSYRNVNTKSFGSMADLFNELANHAAENYAKINPGQSMGSRKWYIDNPVGAGGTLYDSYWKSTVTITGGYLTNNHYAQYISLDYKYSGASAWDFWWTGQSANWTSLKLTNNGTISTGKTVSEIWRWDPK